MDVTKAIEPRSDQKNFDDFLNGPQTFKIKSVEVKNTQEQPVWVNLEGHDGKPWKPSKTSLRCLCAIWGPDASKWSGLSLTLYGDPEVTWGGMKVGGIRVSHMEGLTSPRTLMLTKARGKKGATIIKPLEVNQVKLVKEEPTVDVTAIHEEARGVARQGRDAFTVWWKAASKEQKHAANEIMEELKKLMADAE